MKIRKTTKKDIKEIVKIFIKEYSKQPYNENWTIVQATKRINAYFKNDNIFVLEINKQIEGFIIIGFYYWHVGLRGHINEIAVMEEYQGKGYGKMLMKFGEDYIKSKNAKEISLLTSTKSLAFKMYKNLSYKEEGYVTMYKKI